MTVKIGETSGEFELLFDHETEVLQGLQLPILERVKALLKRLFEKKSFGTTVANKEVADTVNKMVEDYGLKLMYMGKPVTIRVLDYTGKSKGDQESRVVKKNRTDFVIARGKIL